MECAGLQFNESERTVRVEFDASRLKADAVAELLRQAGVDVRERLAAGVVESSGPRGRIRGHKIVGEG